jgi:hypothetical protein
VDRADMATWPTAATSSSVSAEVRVGFKLSTLALAALAAVTMFCFSVPGTYFLVLMWLFYPWFLVGGVWLVLAIVLIGRAGPRSAVRNRWLLGGFGLILVTALAFPTSWPLHIRFQLSRPALEALAVEMARPDAPKLIETRQIGLFDAEWIEPFDGGYRFLVAGAGFISPGGLIFSPEGTPPNIGGEDRYYPFIGPWWIWIEDW